jgi:hypothetical protein
MDLKSIHICHSDPCGALGSPVVYAKIQEEWPLEVLKICHTQLCCDAIAWAP